MVKASFSGSQQERANAIAAVAREAGFEGDELATMVAIAMGESSGNPNAYNPDASTGDKSYGLWQINMLGDMGPERRKWFGISSNEDLLDPLVNARAAKKLYDARGNFNDWSVYKRGDHRKFIDTAATAAGIPASELKYEAAKGQSRAEEAPDRPQFQTNDYQTPPSALDNFIAALSPLMGANSRSTQAFNPVAQDRESVLSSLGMNALPFAVDQNIKTVNTSTKAGLQAASNGLADSPYNDAPSAYGYDVMLGMDEGKTSRPGPNSPPNQGFRTRRPSALFKDRPTVGGDIR